MNIFWNNVRVMNLAASALFALAALIIGAGALYWLSHRPMFVIRTIEVEADEGSLQHVTPATVRAANLPRINGNFFTVNLDAVRQGFETVSWVRHARVRRAWPNRLIVKLEEQRPFALWDDGRLVNTYGELFAANVAEAQADAEGDLPDFSGPVGSEHDVTTRYRDFVTWFAKLGLKPDEVTLSARYAWTIKLDNGTPSELTVEYGREHDANTLADRTQRLLVAYGALTSKWPKLTLVDLRYPNGFALRAEGLHLASEGPKAPPRRAPVTAKPAAVKRT